MLVSFTDVRASVIVIVIGVALLFGTLRLVEDEERFGFEIGSSSSGSIKEQHSVIEESSSSALFGDAKQQVDNNQAAFPPIVQQQEEQQSRGVNNTHYLFDLSRFVNNPKHWPNTVNWGGVSAQRQNSLTSKISSTERDCKIDLSLEKLTNEALIRADGNRLTQADPSSTAFQQSSSNPKETIPRTIYMFWDTGFADNNRTEAQEALISWEVLNPSYQVRALDRSEAERLTDRKRYIPDAVFDKIKIAGQSDIYRTLLLRHYGGIWVDASTTCNMPLDDWLSLDQEELVAFYRTDVKAQATKLDLHPWMSSWFLAAPQKSKLISRVFDIITDPTEFNRFTSEYFWWHRIVAEVCAQEDDIRTRIQSFPTASLPLCHVFGWETQAPLMKRNAAGVMKSLLKVASVCCRANTVPLDCAARSLCPDFNCTVLGDNIRKLSKLEQEAVARSSPSGTKPSQAAIPIGGTKNATEKSQMQLPTELRLLRVPKAGSSSFSAFLRVQYKCTSPEYPPGHCNKDNGFMCPAIKECHGHKPPPVEGDDASLPLMVTFIRDPIERYISAYNYPGHHSKGTNGDIKLHTQRFPEWNDVMTTYFSSHQIGTWHARGVVPTDTSLSVAAEHQSRLDAAIRMTTHRVTYVGLLEYWDDSLRLFCKMFICDEEDLKLSLSAPVQRENRDHSSKAGYPYDDDLAMDAIRKANVFDITLYDATAKRFCSDLAYYCAAGTTDDESPFRSSLSPGVMQFCQFDLGAPG